MKNRMATFLGIISVLVVIAVMVMAYLMLHHPRKMAPINKILAIAPAQHQMLVIDFDGNGLLDEAEIMQGQDGVITVNNPKMGVDEPFNSAGSFDRLDANKDGQINAEDPVFPYLNLMFFTNHGKGRRYESFTQAGIKTILIDQKRLDKPPLSLNPKDNIVGEAILTNGKRYYVRLIMISAVGD